MEYIPHRETYFTLQGFYSGQILIFNGKSCKLQLSVEGIKKETTFCQLS